MMNDLENINMKYSLMNIFLIHQQKVMYDMNLIIRLIQCVLYQVHIPKTTPSNPSEKHNTQTHITPRKQSYWRSTVYYH